MAQSELSSQARLDVKFAWEGDEFLLEQLRLLMAVLEARYQRVEKIQASNEEQADVLVDAGLKRINQVLLPLVEQLQDYISDGIRATSVIETPDRVFYSAARKAEVLDTLRGGVGVNGDTLAKLFTLVQAVIGTPAPAAGRDSLVALAALIDANAAAIITANSNIVAMNTTLAQAVAQLSAGVPTMDAFLSTAVDIAQLKFGTVTLPDGFVDDYDTAGFIDPASTGYFVDTVSGGVIGGVGGQTFVMENVSSLPKMASNTTTATGDSGYAVVASAERYSFANAYKAFDGNTGTIWEVDYGASPLPVNIQMTMPSKAVVAYAITPNGGNYYPSAWMLQGNSGSGWITLDSQSGQAVTNRRVYTVPAANISAYTQYRLVITAAVGGYIQIQEIEFLQYTPAFESHPSLPFMTGNTTTATGATGYVVSETGTPYGASWEPWRAFDGNATNLADGSVWRIGGPPASIQMQTPTAIKLGGYALSGFWNGSNYSNPTAWILEGSNTGVSTDYVTLDARTAQAFTNGGRNVYNIPPSNQGSYKFHRLTITAINSSIGQVSLSSFDLLQVLTGIEGQASIPYHTGPNAVVGGASGYAVSASSTFGSGSEAWRSANGILGADNWAASNGNSTGTWTRQFPAALKVLAYRLWSVGGVNPGSWQLRGSNNGTNWDVLDSRTVGSNFWVNGWNYFVVNAPGSYLYYQMNMLSVVGQSTLAMFDIEFLQGTSGDMSLMSKVYTRNAGVPSKASITLDFTVNAGTLNLNTNVKAQVSRNGGGSYKDVVLSLVGPVNASGRVRYRSPPTDLTDQPADNKLKSRVLLTGGMGINLKAQICLGAT